MKEQQWRIAGMHCPRCESAILRVVRDLEGLSDARVDYRTGTLSAIWDAAILPESILAEHIAEAGYSLIVDSRKGSRFRHVVVGAGFLFMFAALFMLIHFSPVGDILRRFPTAKAGMGMGTLFLIGVMTSLHCVAMCGGINLTQSSVSVQAGRSIRTANVRYNLGRLISYTIIGGIVGAIGSIFQMSTGLQAAIQIIAATFMVIMSLNLLDFRVLRGRQSAAGGILRGELLSRLGGSSLTIGLLNGLMPCGPLQAMQICALSTGSWWMGALSMLCFCIGTVPLMMGFGLVGGRLNKRFARPMRIVSGMLVLMMGISMLSNGLSLSGISVPRFTGAGTERAEVISDQQVVEAELDWRGYPDITVRAGIPVQWNIHAEAEKINGCNNEIVIPALDLRIPLKAGDNMVEFTAEQPGVIPYTCWMGMLHGTITVVE